MMSSTTDTPHQGADHQRTISLILSVAQEAYADGCAALKEITRDVVALYNGEWSAYEACQVGYHTIGHCTDVALLVSRAMVGWNRVEPVPFDQEQFLMGVTAALFHDSGYIKDRGDDKGCGGKFTFTHVERSKRILTDYLRSKKWTEGAVTDTVSLLDVTEFFQPSDLETLYPAPESRRLASILGMADLIAQMSDVNYMANIKELFREFEEAYDFLGRQELLAQGHKVFGSSSEMLNETVSFYERTVLPRLQALGRVDRYLIAFFGDGRNPYLENITANLAGQLLSVEAQWQRIGSVLTALGTISQEQLVEALRRQKNSELHGEAPTVNSFKKRFLTWANLQRKQETLGDILIDMGAIKPKVLCHGLLAQVLPPVAFADLSRVQLELLLKISVMLHSSFNDPWMFEQVVDLVAEQLGCVGGSILLEVPERQEMIVAVSTLLAKEHFEGKAIPADKGLAGWVCSHGQTAIVNSIDQDNRFDKTCDRRSPCAPESLLAVPMYFNGTRFGVVEMFNKNGAGFTESDAALMVMVANIISVALGAILA
ncbi:MAG: GAF domain-containing protein [Desulfobulbaceae bacterium]|nr:GAF domain-containing protein [Desulfobulbaceae bacterium]